MGKGNYIGGSTVIRVHPAKARRRTPGLLALEVQFERHGSVAPQSLLPAAPKKKKKKKSKLASEKFRQVGGNGNALAPAERGKAKSASAAPPQARPALSSSAAKYKAQFSADEIEAYLKTHHPRCPKDARQRIARVAAQGRWTGMAPATVIASCMEHYLAYQVCGIQKLIDFGVDRERAAELVSVQVTTVMALWGKRVWTK